MEQNKTFIPIDLYVLRIDKLKPFDIYLKTHLGRENYVLYSRRGTYFTSRIRQTLLINKVSTIYVPEEDRDIYQEYVEDNLQHIIRDELITPGKKSEIVYDSSKYVMEKLFENPRAEIITRTKKTVNNIVNLILSDQKATKELIRITEYDYSTYTHSVNVGVFSVAFARRLLHGVSEQEFYDLGLGFFLHDIGKSHIPLEILNKRGPLNEEEWQIMKTHPDIGYEMLNQSGFIKKGSAVIVRQHHERGSGEGYPRGLRGDTIHPYAKICSIADTFDAMTTKRCYQKLYTPFESLDFIKTKMLKENFDIDLFEQFVLLFASGS